MDNQNEKVDVVDVHNPDVDVEFNPRLTDAVATAQKLKTLLVGVCSTGKHITTVLCSALSKTSVSDIQVGDMCGRGNKKVTKELLAEHVLTLVTDRNSGPIRSGPGSG